jgi:lysophospholipase L1-like esterase
MDRRCRSHPIPALLLLTAASLVWRLVGATRTVRAQDGFALRDGDRVLFYGDSITEQRLYTTFVEEYVTTRFPRLRIRFIPAGWAGDRVSGGAGGCVDERLRRDVIAEKPTVVTIMLGMNDGGYGG